VSACQVAHQITCGNLNEPADRCLTSSVVRPARQQQYLSDGSVAAKGHAACCTRSTICWQLPEHHGARKCASSSFCVLTQDTASSSHTFKVVSLSPEREGPDVMSICIWPEAPAAIVLMEQAKSCYGRSATFWWCLPMQSAHAPTCGGGGTSAACAPCAAASTLAPMPISIRLSRGHRMAQAGRRSQLLQQTLLHLSYSWRSICWISIPTCCRLFAAGCHGQCIL
jgi:hypothetical protein